MHYLQAQRGYKAKLITIIRKTKKKIKGNYCHLFSFILLRPYVYEKIKICQWKIILFIDFRKTMTQQEEK